MDEMKEKFDLFRNIEHAKDYISKAQEAAESIIAGNSIRLSSDEISKLQEGLNVIYDSQNIISKSLDEMKGWVFKSD